MVQLGRVLPSAEVEASAALGVPVDRTSKPVDVVCQVCFCVVHVAHILAHYEAAHPAELEAIIADTHGPGAIEVVADVEAAVVDGEGMVPW